jgi:hypothetical protein
VARGPPAFHRNEIDGCRCRRLAARIVADPETPATSSVRSRTASDVRVTWTVTSTQGPGTGRLGMHPDVVEARGAPRLEPNRAPDAAGERRRPPVPAEAARRLADRLEGHGVRTGPGAVLEALGVGVPDGAAEPHLELVAALAQDAGDVQSVPAMLVAHLGEDRAVEENRCDGVDSVEDELMVLGGGRAGEGTRTLNPLFTRQVRYQLRHASTPTPPQRTGQPRSLRPTPATARTASAGVAALRPLAAHRGVPP